MDDDYEDGADVIEAFAASEATASAAATTAPAATASDTAAATSSSSVSAVQPIARKLQQPVPQKLDRPPPPQQPQGLSGNGHSGPKIVQPTPQVLPARGSGSSILVSPRQKGNPVLACLRSVPWEYSDIPADYGLGATTCALFLR